MSRNEFELHADRLATSDAEGRRIFLYPADVSGFFRRWRSRVQFVLITFFLILPWIKVDGRQALLLNVGERKFEIFGLSLRAHNAPLLLFVFSTAAFGLFFITSVWGRIWCGWACPQTVFIDGIFRRIERFIEGSSRERKALANAPFSFNKLKKRTGKWFLFITFSLLITHSLLACFVGTDKLWTMIERPPWENWSSFLFIAVSTAIVVFDFAWFREQFCTIVCPYGRFQSVLMDSSSLVVSYDRARGEPRATPQAKVLTKIHGGQLGDCVNCYRCVQVCPTGIDIRRGVQLECVACTSCIDACDEVMTKIKKPTGLIRYEATKRRANSRLRLPARSLVYLGLTLSSVGGLSYALGVIHPVEVTLLRANESPYAVQASPSGEQVVTNHFKLELSNQSGARESLIFKIQNSEETSQIQLIAALVPFVIDDGKQTQTDLFVRFNKNILSEGLKPLHIFIYEKNEVSGETLILKKEVMLVGPFS